MPKGDFDRIAPKIKNPTCHSCGDNDWDIVDDVNGEFPFLTTRRADGNFVMPPNGWPLTMMVCKHCGHIRLYVVPTPAAP